MELYQLQYFAATASTGSMLAAATECGVTQPTLSVQIKALEEEMGVRLFDRHARGARLTRAGERMLGSVNRVIAELAHLRRDVNPRTTQAPSILRVGIQPALATDIMPRALRELLAELPNWRIMTRESRNDQLMELLLGEHVDLCLMAELPQWPAGVVVHQLFKVAFAVYCPAGHPLAGKRSLVLRDLLPFSLIFFDSPVRVEERLEEVARERGQKAKVVFTSDQAATAYAMATAGAGVAVLPAVFGERCRKEGMKQIKLRDAGLTGVVCAVWRRKSGPPPAMERLLALTRAAAPRWS